MQAPAGAGADDRFHRPAVAELTSAKATSRSPDLAVRETRLGSEFAQEQSPAPVARVAPDQLKDTGGGRLNGMAPFA
jgi:hypothetical protein